MQVQSLGYRTDLMVLRMEGSQLLDRPDHVVVRTPDNPSYYWGNFLLFDHPPGAGEGARWLRLFAQQFPAAGHVAIGIDGTQGEGGSWEELAAAGLQASQDVVLSASGPLESPALDPGVLCRPLQGDRDWAQVAEVRLAVADHEGQRSPAHREFLLARVGAARRLAEGGRGPVFGALVEGRVRATLGLVSDGSGWARYQSVETHPDFRRRGLATALLLAASRHGRERMDAHTLVIVAEPDRPALSLYRSLGFADAELRLGLLRPPAR